jgi:hypothetical protein
MAETPLRASAVCGVTPIERCAYDVAVAFFWRYPVVPDRQQDVIV